MGFSSHDAFLNAITVNGQFYRLDWNKLTHATVHVAGEWHCLFHSAGNPPAMVLNGGTNLSFQSCCDQTVGSMMHNGNVDPATKHIINASAYSAAATSCPCVMMLVDVLGFYPMSTVTTTGNQATIHGVTVTSDYTTGILTHTGYDIASFTRVRFTTTTTLPAGLSLNTDYWTVRQSATTSKVATSLANAIAGTTVTLTDNGTGTHTITTGLPRYTDGAGVQCVAVANTTLGAATPNMSINYTNSAGTAGRVTPATLPIGKTGAGIGIVPYSGTGTGKYGPAMPLQASDRGIQSVQQLSLSASYVSGTLAWCMVKPLLTMPLTTVGVACERDCLNQLPSLPRVQDGACLAWLIYSGAAVPASSAYYGHIDFGWG